MTKITSIVVFVDENERLYQVCREINYLQPQMGHRYKKIKRFCGSKMLDNARSYINYLKSQNYINPVDFCDIEDI